MFVSQGLLLVVLSILDSSTAFVLDKRQAAEPSCPPRQTITVTAFECPIISSSAPPSSGAYSTADFTSASTSSEVLVSTTILSSVDYVPTSSIPLETSSQSLVLSSFVSTSGAAATYTSQIPVSSAIPSTALSSFSGTIFSTESLISSSSPSESSLPSSSLALSATTIETLSISTEASTSVPASTSSSVITSEPSSSVTQSSVGSSYEILPSSSLIPSTAASTTYILTSSSSSPFISSPLPSSAISSTTILTVISSASLPAITSVTITTTVISTVEGQTTTVLSTFTQVTTVATTIATTVQVPTTVVSLGTTTVIQYTTVTAPACTIRPSLINGGFEDGNGIDPWVAVATGPNPPTYTTSATPHSGSTSLELLFFPSSSASSYITLTQTVTACPSSNYLVTGYVKANNALSIEQSSNCHIYFQTATQSSPPTLINSSTYPGWSMIYLFFTAPPGDGPQNVQLTVHSYCDSEANDAPGLFVDDFVVIG
ncbi:0565b3cd-7554-43a7-81eb-f16d666fad16 [Sclerotinia trifoliorum]|uniref:0565b3cd-7554-43a7-81eb-f16d666fad16 n=1 Tax=Sclerotinia trifoliorum TaxID=28548 RepID=A0A8H2VTD0_9HELO|nr:0565b3cd-7554-43a7-81eb-f16d666fad16 [Sclerotinia trifoliorum]